MGKIIIDGVDITQLGLNYRKKLSIIPQEGVAFEGSVRYNLDPFDEYSNDDLVEALKLSHLYPHIEKMCREDIDLKPENQNANSDASAPTEVTVEQLLATKITDNGSNLSAGTKQLLCLARALLNKSKVLVLMKPLPLLMLKLTRLFKKLLDLNSVTRQSCLLPTDWIPSWITIRSSFWKVGN